MTSEEFVKNPIHMAIYVFNKVFDDMPSLEDVEGLQMLPRGDSGGEVVMTRLMEIAKKKEYPKEHLFYLGNIDVLVKYKIYLEMSPVYWEWLEEGINYSRPYYCDKEYEDVGEGICKIREDN